MAEEQTKKDEASKVDVDKSAKDKVAADEVQALREENERLKKEAAEAQVQKEAEEKTKAEAAEAETPTSGDECWNCANHGKTTYLKDGVCLVCGFDKNITHNLYLDGERERKRRIELRKEGYVVKYQ